MEVGSDKKKHLVVATLFLNFTIEIFNVQGAWVSQNNILTKVHGQDVRTIT